MIRLVEETESHVVVGLLLLLLLLLLLGRLGRSCAAGRCWCRGRGGASTSRTDVGEDLLDVLALERLSEEGRPDRLELDARSGGQGDNFVRLDKWGC